MAWGDDPIQQTPTAPAAPAGGAPWGNDPVVGSQNFKFSDSAIKSALSRPGSTTVWMKPAEYLALAPELTSNPKTDKKGASLQKSLDKGDSVDEVPSLRVAIGKDGTAKVTDQDGRHRALFAEQNGLDRIPVRVDGGAGAKAIVGMRDDSKPVDFNFAEVTPPPAPPKKPNVGVGSRFLKGVMDPLLGLGQLEFHAAELGAKGIDTVAGTKLGDKMHAVNTRLDTNAARKETEYQDARKEAAGGKDPGFDYARTAGEIASPVNYVPLGAVSKVGQAAVLAKRAEPVIAGLVRSVARNAATTGTGGAVIASLNPVTGGDFWDEKTKQAAVGLAAGTVVPPVFAAGSKALIKAGSATVAPLVRYVAGIKGPQAALTAAEKEIMRRLSEGTAGGGPTAQDMLDLASRTPDKPLTLMDVGSQPVNALAGRVYRTGGQAKQRIADALVDRTAAQGQRLEGDVGKGLSSQKAYSTVEAMQQSRANAAAPLYQKAYEANQNMASPVIDKILETPAGQAALKSARTKMQNDMTLMGKPDPELAEQIKESGQQLPFRGGVASGLKLRTLDYVKRSLDDMIGSAQRAGEKDNARILTGMKQSLVSEMDKADVTAKAGPNSVKPEGGLYKQARAAYSGPSQSMEALEFGQNALKPSTSIEENAARFKELNPNDQEFARIGLAQGLRDMIGKKDVGTNAARTLARNPAVQARIRPFFKSDADYTKFIDRVTAEDNMFHAVNRTMGNSATAERTAEDNSADANAMAHAAHAGIHLSGGNVLGGAASLWRAVSEYARRPNPELADEMAKLLTAPLHQQTSPGMKLLRDFSAVAPGTKNYLAQATNRAAGATTVPAGVAAGQQPHQ